jgi:uncharacterized protein YaiL (DUF2058 family)
MQSLKDKLMKAGLVSEEAAQRASRPAEVEHKVEHAFTNRPPGGAIPKLPPLPGSPAAQRQQSQKQLETDRQVRARVNETFIDIETGPRAFYFPTRKGKARRLDISEAQALKLEAGELAIVERPDPGGIEHALVPAAVALELKQLNEKAVRFLNGPDEPKKDGATFTDTTTTGDE